MSDPKFQFGFTGWKDIQQVQHDDMVDSLRYIFKLKERNLMQDHINALRQAIAEIKRLRHANDILAAKVSVMDIFAKFVPPPIRYKGEAGATMQPDPLLDLERHLHQVERVHSMTQALKGKSSWDQEAQMMQASQQGAHPGFQEFIGGQALHTAVYASTPDNPIPEPLAIEEVPADDDSLPF